MARSRFGLLCVVVSVALLASGLTAVAVTRPDNKGEGVQLPSLAAEPFAVTLSAALSGSSTIVGQPVTLGSQAIGLGHEVAALELWDGNRIVERSASNGGTSFTWVPLNTGAHLLHARGIAKDGKTARSAPVSVDVLALRIKVPPVVVPTTPGETGTGLAARLGVAPSRITLLPRTGRAVLASSAPVPAGAVAQVAVTRSAQPEPSESIVADPAPEGVGTPMGATVVPPPFIPGTYTPEKQAPLALPDLQGPTVSAESDGCEVTLKVTGTGGGRATVESVTAGSVGFEKGVSRGGDGALALKGLAPGVHVWDVRTSEGVSSPVSATVPETCGTANGWKGDSSLVKGVLTIPAPAKDVYVYLGVDDKPFVRIPQSHDEYLSAPTKRVDVSSLLPALGGKKVVMEVWRKVDQYSSKQFGTGVLNATEGQSLQDVIGEPTAIQVKMLTPQGLATSGTASAKGSDEFRWTASSPRVTGVFWQVLAAPLTPKNTDLSAYSLVKGGFSMSTGSGSFLIDASTLPTLSGKPAAVTLGAPDLMGFKPTLPGGSKPSPTTITTEPLQPAVVGRFWVRVIPLVHTEGQLFDGPMGIASSNVVVDLPVPVKPPVTFTVASLSLRPGAIANPGLRSCIRVTATPWKGPAPPDFSAFGQKTAAETAAAQKALSSNGLQSVVAQAFYPYPGTYCNGDFKTAEACDDLFCYFEDAIGAFVDFVGTAWDYIAAAYNGIINLAVTLFAKFNPVCLALTISKSPGQGTCEQVAGVVGRAAISAVLAAYGLPPSLPTSKDLVSIAQGDLGVLAVELMKQIGVPCDSLKLDEAQSQALVAGGKEAGVSVPNVGGKVDACLYAATQAINAVKKQVISQTQTQVAAAAGLPTFDVDGFLFIPEPKGHLQPTTVSVVAVPSRPIGAFESLFVGCNVTTTVSTKSGNPAPFKNATGRLHRIPTMDPKDPLAQVAAAIDAAAQAITGTIPDGAWAESFVMSEPSSPNLDVDSVYEGLQLKTSLIGSCLSGPVPTVTAAYGPPLPR